MIIDSASDGLLFKFIVQTGAGIDVSDQLVETIGPENVVSKIAREPTLEEAYIHVFQEWRALPGSPSLRQTGRITLEHNGGPR